MVVLDSKEEAGWGWGGGVLSISVSVVTHRGNPKLPYRQLLY